MPTPIVQPMISFDDLKKSMDDYVETTQFDEPADPKESDGTFDPDEAWVKGEKAPAAKKRTDIQI